MNQAHVFGVGVLLAAAGLAGGCSSSQMSRIDQNRDLYEQWPLEVRQAVLDGRVEPGMTQDQVFVAWGKPAEVVTQSRSGDEIWVYKRGGSSGDVMYPGGMGHPGTTSGAIMGGGPGVGISTGRGGTSIGAIGGIGVGMGGGGGAIIGPTGGMGGMGAPIVTPPTPPDVREVVFRGGVVLKADKPFDK